MSDEIIDAKEPLCDYVGIDLNGYETRIVNDIRESGKNISVLFREWLNDEMLPLLDKKPYRPKSKNSTAPKRINPRVTNSDKEKIRTLGEMGIPVSGLFRFYLRTKHFSKDNKNS